MKTTRNALVQACALAALLLLSGCGSLTRTPYTPPNATLPVRWEHGPAETAAQSDRWYLAFGDPALASLIDQALLRNNDLAAAAIKVRKAQLEAGLAEDKLRPTLGAQADTSYGRNLRHRTSEPWSHSLYATSSYEANLWGRLGSKLDAAEWEARATEADRESTALSLVGTTATLYWEIAYLNERLSLSSESIAYAEKTLALVQAQYRAGATSSLELAESEQNLASQQASRTELEQQLVEARNSLSILFDGPPGTSDADPRRMPDGRLLQVDAGLPAEILGRRPDLRAAELRLREALSTVDATRESYYPCLTLTGTLGATSSELHSLMENPIGTLAASLTLPFLQWNEMQLSIAVSKAEYDEAVVNFRQTLYTALSEVENALSSRRQYAEQGARLEREVAAAREAERLYAIRYRAGSVSLQSWLDAQEKRRTAEVTLAENRLHRLTSYVTLCQALGGDARNPAGASGQETASAREALIP